MPAVTRLGDRCTGHGCWPPRASTGASPDVRVDGTPVHRVGDAWAAHTCPAIPETHASVLAGGSPTVFANGRPVGRIGDAVACGSAVATGSGTVYADALSSAGSVGGSA